MKMSRKLKTACGLAALLCAATAWGEALDASLFAHSALLRFSGYTLASPLENFPVLVRLAEGSPSGFSYADCAQDAFRFADLDGNALPHDVETWNPEGTSLVWVSVPSLERGMVIRFLHGATATAALPANDPAAVWTRAQYAGVWHMAEASGTVADAAGNGLVATPIKSAANLGAVEGVIGNGRTTGSSTAKDGYLSVPSYDALGIGSTFTISGWVKAEAGGSYPRLFSRKKSYTDANGWEIELANNTTVSCTVRAAYNNTFGVTLPDLANTWRHLAFAYANTSCTVYGDGAARATGGVAATAPDNGVPLAIGASGGGGSTFYGAFDEVRLRRVASSADWIQTEYASAHEADFATWMTTDDDATVYVTATAGTGGTVAIGDGAPVAAVQSEGATFGAQTTTTLTAQADEGYHFFRWTGDTLRISSGDPSAPTITVTTRLGAALTAEFISTANGGYIVVTNAFDHPSGGFTTASYAKVAGSIFSNQTDCVIAFAAPEEAPAGLREFRHDKPSRTTFTTDWGLFTSFAVGTSAETREGVACAAEARTGLTGTATLTYAGSWYVPAAGAYAFRMNMTGAGRLVIDNAIVLQQTTAKTAVAVRDVALAKGWHNLYIVFTASSGAIGPADAAVNGLLYSAANADLAVDPAAGAPFATEEGENGHRFSTAFNGVFVPSLWAAGGDVVLDCANALGDVRIAGQWGSTAHAFTIANLPAGRVVELGRPNALNSDRGWVGWQSLEDWAYVDWSRTTLPAGVTVRFTGMAVVDAALPTTWTLGARAFLATSVPDFFGFVANGSTDYTFPDELVYLQVVGSKVLGDTVKLHVPDNCALGYMGGYLDLENYGKKLPIRAYGSSNTFKNDVELIGNNSGLNETLTWDGGSTWQGAVTGAGYANITGWGRRMILDGPVTANLLSASQLACRILLRPPADAAASRIDSVYITSEGSAKTADNQSYSTPEVFYCPRGEGAPALEIGTLSVGGATWTPSLSKQKRGGSALGTCSNNTVRVRALSGSGVHLRTSIPGGATDEKPEGAYGPGNFEIGEITSATTIYVSSNANVTVTNVNKAMAVRYDTLAGCVNDATLDIKGACAASTVVAPDVASLPARLTGFVGEVTIEDTAEATWPITIDFARTAPNHGGCDGSGTLVAAPAQGKITVAFEGRDPTAGDYGLLRFTEGGDLLANWTIETPTYYARHSVTPMKDATGLWLRVRRSGGVLILR